MTLDEFPFTFIPPVTLRQLTPVNATYESGAFTGSGFGTVQGNVIPVDINLVPAAGQHERMRGRRLRRASAVRTTSPSIQRGTCSFGVKALNAQNAGAEAVVIFNQGDTPLRVDLIVGTLLPDGAAVTIPVVGASFADGAALAQRRLDGSHRHRSAREPSRRST